MSSNPLASRLSEQQNAVAERAGAQMAQLVRVLMILRGENGCPWDREQTALSLRPYLLEECHEVLEAIEDQNGRDLREELGDLLMHLAFQAQIAFEEQSFELADSLSDIVNKLVSRHPHVFAQAQVEDAREVEQQWERIKTTEKKHRDSILDGLPRAMPALLLAQRIQEKVAGVGFEWPEVDGAIEKLHEELAELAEALKQSERRREDEFGDFLFSVVNVARYLGVHPEEALRSTNAKFVSRFRLMEKLLREAGYRLAECDLETMDRFWEQAKGILRKQAM